MRHHLFADPSDTYPVAILCKASAFIKMELEMSYVEPLVKRGVAASSIIAFTLDYNASGKAPAAFIKEYLSALLPELDSLGAKYLYVADAAYFKVLAGQAKADPHFGYVLPCKIKGYEHLQVVLGLNYQSLIYNPDLQSKLDLSLEALSAKLDGTYAALGSDIIHSAQYPAGVRAIAEALNALHQYPELTCDIEAFSLRFYDAGIGTISFAWDEHNGIAFACDYHAYTVPTEDGNHGEYRPNAAVRFLLLKFFSSYSGKLIFHNAPYDVKAFIYTLWMASLGDTRGMMTGLDIMTRSFDDTKLIAYLATNSTAGNVLGLKSLAHEFAGNWAKEDIKDIRRIPLADLLQYNLVDALSTHYVKKKYAPIMAADNQEALYRDLFIPSQKLIIQMEMVGMPMGKAKIQEVKARLEGLRDKELAVITSSPVIAQVEKLIRHAEWEKDFEGRKAKAKNPDKIAPKEIAAFDSVRFNPNSGPQLQRLLYEVMQLPVIDYTDTKMPATGAETLDKLINHATDPAHKALLSALIGHGQVVKILNTFIPAFEQAQAKADDGIVWLFGSFNLGGTVSGRLSSSDPNLQNIPAKSTFGKLIKECFMAPPGWLFCGADFNSLEDYISALTTKDPNKLNVYIRGFDGHSLRAAYYFAEELKNEGLLIDLDDPKSVNILKKTDHPLRQESKAPTFLLTYGGTYHGMMSNLGWPEAKSRSVEANYHELYKVSDQYVADRLKQAARDGYVDVAFGLRVRTPLLKQVLWGGPKMPYEAAAEGRTAGNALGQSYGQLNNRAAVAFWQRVWKSPYRYDILPSALIHDAIYPVIKDDLEVVEWANNHLIAEMQWQELPEIQHETVKLGANLDIYWPSWAHPITLPNGADQATILQLCKAAKEKLEEKQDQAA